MLKYKTGTIPGFEVYNDTHLWAVVVNGYHGFFDTKEEAQKVCELIEDIDDAPWDFAQILPPQQGSSSGFDVTISKFRAIDIEAYIIKRKKRVLQTMYPDTSTPQERLQDKKDWENIWCKKDISNEK